MELFEEHPEARIQGLSFAGSSKYQTWRKKPYSMLGFLLRVL